ncbi:MAG: hypothetical protein GXX93_12955 [Anaerolineae bacterium]|nr:hypothetical protein [Anaerolineae bacterium]
MAENLVSALPLVVAVTALTAVLVYLRAEQLGAEPGGAGSAPDGRLALVVSYAIAGLIFGAAAVVVYRLMEGRYGAGAADALLRLAVGTAAALSLLAAVVLPRMERGGAAECITLNLVWGLGYGLFLPRLLG